MIQRIQTLFLSIALALIVLMLVFPLAQFVDANHISYKLMYNGLFQFTEKSVVLVQYNYFVSTFIIIAVLLLLISIFLFKKRLLQIRICWVSILALAIIATTEYIVYNSIVGKGQFNTHALSLTAIMPVLSVILTYLAIRAIKKDDDLVKSVDRLR